MGFLTDLASQLKRLWDNSTPTVRGIYAIAVASCLAVLVAVGWWSSRPQYIALAHNLSPDKAGEIIAKLDAAGIPNQMNLNGSIVLVPKSEFGTARVQVSTLISPDQEPPEDMGSILGGDPSEREARQRRNLESRLARAIEANPSVKQAVVLLGQAEQSPFLTQRKPSKASVILTLHPGASFSRGAAATIARQVASSEENLVPENVSVTDTSGNMWHGDGELMAPEGHLAMLSRTERDRENRIIELLDGILGPGRSKVTVTAEMDFTTIKTTKESLDTKPVKIEETVSSSKLISGSTAARGPAGVSSNNASSVPRGSGSDPMNETTESITSKSEVGRETTTTHEFPGKITRLSVAAAVDIPTPEEGAKPILDQAAVEELIQSAIGFDQTRGDKIKVVIGPLQSTQLMTDVMVVDRWQFYNDLARSASLGIASLVALFFGLKTFRKFKDVVKPPVEETSVSPDRLRVLSEFTQRARENPEAMKAVISAWLNQPEGGAAKEDSAKAA